MAIVSAGFDGTVDEIQAAKMARFTGAEYAVGSPDAFKVSAVAAPDRTVQIAAGAAFGHGVLCESNAVVTLQAPAVSSGSRWDTVVLRRNWQPPGGEAVPMILQGSSAQLVAASRKSGPGVEDDQLLALVRFQAGQTLPQEVIDLRTWPSKVIAASNLLALGGAPLGAEAVVSGVRYRRELDSSSNLAWVKDRTNFAAGIVATEATASAVIVTVDGWTAGAPLVNRALTIGNMVQLDLGLRRTGADISAEGDVQIATIADAYRPDRTINIPMLYFGASGNYGGLLRLASNGALSLTSGYPGENIPRKTDAAAVSIAATAFFMVKGS